MMAKFHDARSAKELDILLKIRTELSFVKLQESNPVIFLFGRSLNGDRRKFAKLAVYVFMGRDTLYLTRNKVL